MSSRSLFPKPKPACHSKNLGLERKELACFSGFTSHGFYALAHLREAWLSADVSTSSPR